MILFRRIKALQNHLDLLRLKGIPIGFVPTMGALHDGHSSLVVTSKDHGDFTVTSIFINPAQFNDPADYQKYPVTTASDLQRLIHNDNDIVFMPDADEMYPADSPPPAKYDLGFLETILEGKFRPGHFQGVCLIVEKLLNIVRPAYLYLGQKDYQQCMVIARLAELMGIEKETKLIVCPTLRENDGLAMSSRNMRLDKEQRHKAVTIFRSLQFVRENIQRGPVQSLLDTASQMLTGQGFRIDYVAIADAKDLRMVTNWDGQQKIVCLVAAFLGDVRLIDNMLLN
jgi:pantoate--beta-alanine ligase